MQEAVKKIPSNATMRDIFDFCQKWGLENLAQGMIELSPPLKLREIASELIMEDSSIHTYRNRFGEMEYRLALVRILKEFYKIENISVDNVLATSGVR
jgi:aspartate/methionine/tyrosine aminotransferase